MFPLKHLPRTSIILFMPCQWPKTQKKKNDVNAVGQKHFPPQPFWSSIDLWLCPTLATRRAGGIGGGKRGGGVHRSQTKTRYRPREERWREREKIAKKEKEKEKKSDVFFKK